MSLGCCLDFPKDDFTHDIIVQVQVHGIIWYITFLHIAWASSNRNEKYRIIILPWPAFTDAFKAKDQESSKEGGGGNLIEGIVSFFQNCD